MTVHLLANAGQGLLLQQTLDRLLDCICPDIRLFLVSERASPVKYYDKCYSKRSRFPGMSVLLFLQENLGEERLFRVLDSLQHWPWQCYPTQNAQGRPCPYSCQSGILQSGQPDAHLGREAGALWHRDPESDTLLQF